MLQKGPVLKNAKSITFFTFATQFGAIIRPTFTSYSLVVTWPLFVLDQNLQRQRQQQYLPKQTAETVSYVAIKCRIIKQPTILAIAQHEQGLFT